jgi:tetratricopeptide (TPR) repeat protein
MIRIMTWLLVGLSSSIVLAADPWIGKPAFWKPDAKARSKVGNEEIDIATVSFPAMVQDVDGDWLLLEKAWVRKSDVMKTEEAFDYYNERIRQKPLEALAWRNRGIIWSAKGGTDNTMKDFAEALRLDPKEVRTYNIRSLCWYGNGEFERAIQDSTEAIRLDPTNAEAYSNRAIFRERIGDDDKAMQDNAEAIRLDPKYWHPYWWRSFSRSKKGDYHKAIEDLSEALRLDPKNPTVYDTIAQLQATCPDEHVRDGRKAVQNATTACELTAWEGWPQIDTLAAAYAEAGDFANAVKWEENAIALSAPTGTPGSQFLQHKLALYKSGKPLRLTDAIPTEPATLSPDTQITIGMKVIPAIGVSLDTPLKEGDRTIATLKDLRWPFNVEHVNGDLLRIGDMTVHGWVQRSAVIPIDDVIKAQAEAIQKTPTAGNYHNRGNSWSLRGDFDMALSDFSTAILLDPDSAHSFYARAGVWLQKNDYKNAISDATEALRLSTDRDLRISAYSLRAIAYEQAGKKEAAESDRREEERLKNSLSRRR